MTAKPAVHRLARRQRLARRRRPQGYHLTQVTMTLFAEAGTRQDVENALATARDQLRVVIE